MKYLHTVIFLILIISCHTNKKDTNKRNSVPIVEIGKALNNITSSTKSFTEFIDSIKYIPLETLPECNIEEIQKIVCYKGDFYTWDYYSILKFDANGKFIQEIGKRGKGPKEYARVREFTIRSDKLYINEGRKIVAYSTIDGSFVSTYPFRNRWFVDRLNNQFVTINANNGFIEFIDEKGNITDSVNYEHFTQNDIFPEMMIYPIYDAFFGTSQSLKISTSHNDTLFEINKRCQLIPRYILDLGDYKLPEKERLEYSGDFENFDKSTTKLIRPVPLETNDYLVIQSGKWGTVSSLNNIGFYDKKADLLGFGIFDKKGNSFSLITEDLESYPFFFPHFSDEENGLFSWVDAIDMINFYNKNKDKYNFCSPFISTVKKLEIDYNPVLVMVKLKE
ncbi:6-bladed beta-propeller [Draconibacterium orientale]|uniref:6-bladed beta-propeller n=1 Tax=Draconibacterium orientale TaxID=1168034 RepID=UPI0029BFBA37|nr:6-bladed beta-propeller [Draconibacterium orientale]